MSKAWTTPNVNATKSGDRLTITIRRKYHPNGAEHLTAHRWDVAGVFSLSQLRQEEKERGE